MRVLIIVISIGSFLSNTLICMDQQPPSSPQNEIIQQLKNWHAHNSHFILPKEELTLPLLQQDMQQYPLVYALAQAHKDKTSYISCMPLELCNELMYLIVGHNDASVAVYTDEPIQMLSADNKIPYDVYIIKAAARKWAHRKFSETTVTSKRGALINYHHKPQVIAPTVLILTKPQTRQALAAGMFIKLNRFGPYYKGNHNPWPLPVFDLAMIITEPNLTSDMACDCVRSIMECGEKKAAELSCKYITGDTCYKDEEGCRILMDQILTYSSFKNDEIYWLEKEIINSSSK